MPIELPLESLIALLFVLFLDMSYAYEIDPNSGAYELGIIDFSPVAVLRILDYSVPKYYSIVFPLSYF